MKRLVDMEVIAKRVALTLIADLALYREKYKETMHGVFT